MRRARRATLLRFPKGRTHIVYEYSRLTLCHLVHPADAYVEFGSAIITVGRVTNVTCGRCRRSARL